MKKFFMLIAAILTISTLTACTNNIFSSSFTCEGCQKEKSGTKHKITIADKKATLCDECYEQLKSFGLTK